MSFQTLLDNISALATDVGNKLQLRGFKTGGTAGQIPVKSSGTDFNQTWADGDIVPVKATGTLTRRSLGDRFADVVCPLDFGAVGDGVADDTVAIQAAIDYAAALTRAGGVLGVSRVERRVDFAGRSYKISSTIFMRNAKGLRLVNGELLASSAFTIGVPMMEIKTSSTEGIVSLSFDCNKRAAGVYIPSNSSALEWSFIYAFKEYGVYVTGTVNMYECVVEQVTSNDPDFEDVANLDGDGIRCAASDVSLVNSKFRYCGCPMRFMAGCYTTRVTNCHACNGSGPLETPRIRSKNIIVEEGCGSVNFNNCYLDNGEIDLYSHTVQFVGCQMLMNPAKIAAEYFIALYAREVGNLKNFLSTDWRLYLGADNVPFIAFLDNGDSEWGGDYAAIKSESARQLDTIAQGKYGVASIGGDDEPFAFSTPRNSARLVLKNANGGDFNRELESYQDYMVIKGGDKMVLSTHNTWRAIVDADGNFYPQADDTYTLGASGHKWSVVYAGSGTINTSDSRQKQDIATLSVAEAAVATALKGLIKKFRYISAVAAKGDEARIHVGVIAQEVKAAFEAEGLVAERYGILCYDEWEAEEASEGKPARAAGNSYGIRYDELLAFIISAL